MNRRHTILGAMRLAVLVAGAVGACDSQSDLGGPGYNPGSGSGSGGSGGTDDGGGSGSGSSSSGSSSGSSSSGSSSGSSSSGSSSGSSSSGSSSPDRRLRDRPRVPRRGPVRHRDLRQLQHHRRLHRRLLASRQRSPRITEPKPVRHLRWLYPRRIGGGRLHRDMASRASERRGDTRGRHHRLVRRYGHTEQSVRRSELRDDRDQRRKRFR